MQPFFFGSPLLDHWIMEAEAFVALLIEFNLDYFFVHFYQGNIIVELSGRQ